MKFIKYVTSLVLIVGMTFCTIGCSSTSTTTDSTDSTTTTSTTVVAPADNATFVTAVTIVTGVLKAGGVAALAYATSDSDRVLIAEYLSGSGHVFEALETGTVPTTTDIENAMSAYFPTTASSYTTIVQLAVSAWQTALPIIKTYVGTTASNYIDYVNYVLKALAQTAYTVAAPYLTTTSTSS